MTTRRRLAVLAVFVAAGGLWGCGSQNDCTLTPPVSHAPSSCTLRPGPVTVSVRWCSCGATTICRAGAENGGVIQLEPVVNSCDASCPDNPGSCPASSTVCTFDAPGEGPNYHLYVIDGQSFVDVPLVVSNSAGTSCG